MNAPVTRKALSQIVGLACETGFPGPHSAGEIQVRMKCACGHGEPEDYDPTPACTHCLRRISAFIETGDTIACAKCDHGCGLDITAEWTDGRSVVLHFPSRTLPEDMRWESLSKARGL